MMKLDRKNVEEILALTPMQEGMLFHYLKDPCSDYYFEQLNLDIPGEIDQGRFEKAWNFVIETNHMLRAVFRWEKVENPIQIILKEHKFYPTYYDFSNKTAAEANRQLETVKAKDREEKFDLKEVPFRVTLCKVKEDKYEMIISNHHILYDGWSNGIILREFFKAYNDLCNGKELVKPVKTKFKEFVKWIQNRDINKDKKFWKEYLNGFEPKTGIPGETKGRKTKEITNTGTYRLKFPDELKEPLVSFTRSQKVPLSVLLYSAWGVLLQEYNSRDDMVYDTTVSGRSAKLRGIEEIVGLFINTVPLRVKVSSGERTRDFISRMAAAIRQREEFENSSLLDIKEYLDVSNNGILFDSVVIIENYPLDKKLMQGRELSVFERTGYDLTVIITTFDDIEIHFTYNKELFDEEIIAGLSGHFVQVVRAFIENSREKISGINILLEEEKSRILNNLKRCREVGWGTGNGYTYKEPGNELEERLAEIWASVLKVEKSRIGIDMNFFDFGGHSLNATLLSAGIHKELGVKVSLGDVFRFPTIEKLAGYIRKSKENKGEDRYVPVKPVEKREYYRLAPAQRRLYMLQQLNPGSTVYNGPLIMVLKGLIDKEHTALSFKRLIQRHEMLRTSFVQQDGEPVQKIHEFDEVEFEIEYFNLTAKTREDTRIKEESFIIHHFVRAFDLSKAPLLRVGLVKIEEQKHFLMIDMHHIVTDGTSRDILTGEFASLYNGEALSPLKIQYKEYSEWQNERLLKGKLKVHEEFWLKHLSGELPVLNLPADFPRPVMQSFDGERIVFELDSPMIRQLHMLMKETGTTLYMVLMSVYSILLGWYSGQEDILVGVPIAGRNHADLEDAVGLFLETLVVRNQPLGDKTFEQVLREVKDTALKANEHQDYPFSELVKRVAAAKMNDLSRNPLFDAMLNVLNQNNSDLEIEGVQILPYTFDAKVSKVDMTLEAMEVDDGEGDKIRLELEYCTSLFKRATMERFTGHFLNTLREAVEKPGIRLGDMEIIDKNEKRQILGAFNHTTTEYAADKTFMEYFEIQVEKNPENIAVIGSETHQPQHFTYRQLNRQANRLARFLRKKGVEPDSIVGVMVDRSPRLIVGLLGILKSGGAYLPLDPAYPGDRREYMLKDSQTRFLITEDKFRSKVTFNSEIILLENRGNQDNRDNWRWDWGDESNPVYVTHPGDLAYIIYTSGSTGKPKGVMVRHKNLTAYIHAFTREFELREADVVLQQASYSFDAFVEEVFPCLVKGGTLALPSGHEVRDTALLCRFIAANKVSMIDCSPLLLNELNRNTTALHTVHTFISGGDVLKGEYIRNLLEIGAVYNTYGPTETTICATYHRLNREESSGIPIGKPIANYQTFIIDLNHRLLPIGVAGEICISGAGVTRGYLNQPELTAEKFLFISYRSHRSYRTYISKRLYKTGDLGRWLPDGSIEFLGRKDRQVNIRGFRIELGEIETQLLAHEDINNAAAVVLGKDKNAVCAYFTAHTQKTLKEMKEFLSKKLPDYMIPAYFVQLEELPLGAGGKINVKALPEPAGYRLETGVEYVPPKGELEGRLAGLWQELLGLERIGTADDFFDLGGDSILANRCIAAIREKLDVEIPLRKFFERPYIKALVEEIEKQDRQAVSVSIRKASKDVDIPLSFPQERLWFLQNLDPESTSYFVPRVIRIKGKPEEELLERTFSEIIRRHEILRTVFVTRDGLPVQEVQPPHPFKIPVIDWTGLEEPRQSQQVARWIEGEGQRAFDFEKGPLLRVTLLKLKEHEHLLVLTEHHLIHDGWTQGVLLREFITIFSACLEGRPHGLAELPIQYADYAYWQRNYLQGEVLENLLDYWKKKLEGVVQILELPTDRARPTVMSGRGALKDFHLSVSLTRQLKDFSRKNGVTLFMTMLAVFKALLYRYTGAVDLCVGTGIANRGYKEIEGMLGMVINTLPLRTQLSGDISFAALLNRVKKTCLEAYQYQDTPFGKIVEVMEPERSLSYNPLFQVMFSFMDTPTEDLWLPGLELHLELSHNRSSKFDINVVVVPPEPRREGEEGAAGETLVEWEYNTDLFEDSTMDRMLNRYIRLLEEVVNHPGRKISALHILEADEINRLLVEWNRTGSDYPKEKTIHGLFREQAEKTPERTALVGKEKRTGEVLQLTYGELNRRSDQLAYLLREKGVLADNIVGIMLERSVEMIIGILAILKAGGAYLPLDPEYPEERIHYMLADSNARVLVSELSEVSKVSEGTEVVKFSELSEAFSTHLCYVIYTSGTTGRPKGTLTSHFNVTRVVKNTNYIDITPDDRILQLSNYAFDGSVFDIYGALLNGAALVMVEKEEVFWVEKLSNLIKREVITVFFVTTALFNKLVEMEIGCLKNVKKVLFGGEKVSVEHSEKALEYLGKDRVIHVYGPTETTVYATYYFINKIDKNSPTIPIGKPISNTTVYILDRNNAPVPLGIGGELYIGGDGTARGYLNNPELTAERFVDHRSYRSYRSYISKKLYKTGDLVRWLGDGNIEFLGRIDHQVKIRGFRIELGEIENQLLAHELINEAVVIDRIGEDGEKYLCAYIVLERASAEGLKEYLSRNLPGYMIPSYFIQIDKIPLNPSGKVDRKALPEPVAVSGDQYTAPRDEVEKKLVDIWSRVLARDALQTPIGIDDNFFDLGGHSLKASVLASGIHKEMNVKVPLPEVMRNPTIRQLSAYIKDAVKEEYAAVEPVEKREFYALSYNQKRLWVIYQLEPESASYHLSAEITLNHNVNEETVRKVLQMIVQRHESFRTRFEMVDNKPVQLVEDHVDVPFNVIDMSALDKDEKERKRARIYAETTTTPFDFSKAPLFRSVLLKEDEEKFHSLFTLHHIITDGWSMGILKKEFSFLYESLRNREPVELEPVKLQYKDFSTWYNKQIEAPEVKEKSRRFWEKKLEKGIPVLYLPGDFGKSRDNKDGGRYRCLVSEDIKNGLKKLARNNNTTFSMAMFSAFIILLSQLAGQQDITCALISAGRNHISLSDIVGYFTNSVLIISRLAPGETIADFLERLDADVLETIEHQNYPVELVLDDLKINYPDIPAAFNMLNLQEETGEEEIETFPPEHIRGPIPDVKFDIELYVTEYKNGIEVFWNYNKSLFKPSTIELISRGYLKLLNYITNQ